MKTKILYILALTMLLAAGLTSCDKIDDNGNLGGMWQCTEWKSLPDGKVIADKHSDLFYAVQLDLMKFSINNDMDTYHLARFAHKNDSLIITKVYSRPKDVAVACTELAKYGVPANGKFAIIELTSSKMVLKSDQDMLTFRKY